MAESRDIWKELRKPFDPKVIGSLPKPYKKDSLKGKCSECGGFHGLPAVHLDYVGHAAITDRLLTVDPLWTWEPVALDERGLPQYDGQGGLWIKLTIGGVTRLGYGDGPDPKQRIGDALRNAAMRFGVALDLWTKDELESHLDAPELKNEKPSENQAAEKLVETISSEQITELMNLAKLKGYKTKEEAVAFLDAAALGPFTKIEDYQFDNFKKMVISAGWKKPEADSNEEPDDQRKDLQ